MLADSDRTVIMDGLPLERALQIVRELKTSGVAFEWYYKPPAADTYVRSVTFVFEDVRYAPWFELKYR